MWKCEGLPPSFPSTTAAGNVGSRMHDEYARVQHLPLQREHQRQSASFEQARVARLNNMRGSSADDVVALQLNATRKKDKPWGEVRWPLTANAFDALRAASREHSQRPGAQSLQATVIAGPESRTSAEAGGNGAVLATRDVPGDATTAGRASAKGVGPVGVAKRTAGVQPAQVSSHSEKPLALQVRRPAPVEERPAWHAPWTLMRVISGHLGWVRAIAVDPANEFVVTGSADRTIKIWDLASGKLKLTLTGHVHTIRGLAVSERHPYMFSAGEDKMVKCWDLEYNKAIRHYHGHLSGVYALALHPTLDVLVTGGRDSVARVWDMRSAREVHCLGGHRGTVGAIVCQANEPQVVTGSMDTTVRLWDIAAGRCRTTLTHHKKAVRGLCLHPREYTFLSAGADNLKQWRCPEGTFLKNLSGHNSIVNTVCTNAADVLVSGGDDGSLHFWDWKSGHCFQQEQARVQPGSLDSEAGIYASCFDVTGSRLFTCEADKTIKVWKENASATPETDPIRGWNGAKRARRF